MFFFNDTATTDIDSYCPTLSLQHALPISTLIEHFTYRAEGHSTSDDPSQYRSARESDQWPLGDPIARLKRHLISLGIWDMDRYAALDLEMAEYVRDCAKEAEKNGILGHGLHQPDRKSTRLNSSHYCAPSM